MTTILLLSFLFMVFAFLLLVTKPNLLFILFALEIILIGANVNFIFASVVLNDFLGKFIALILFSVAALDTSVGLILLLNYYSLHNVVYIQSNIKG